uniref:Uncharacterized protein n=1 Tax=Arundo donax TaxID=35708 RepID=A0A0A9DRM6_ARUDO
MDGGIPGPTWMRRLAALVCQSNLYLLVRRCSLQPLRHCDGCLVAASGEGAWLSRERHLDGDAVEPGGVPRLKLMW